jgi:GTP-binding protein
MVKMVYENGQILIPTSKLNNLIQTAYIKNPPRFAKNKIVKVKYITQDKDNPNRFIVFVNDKEKVNFAFKKWLENVIRKEY